MTTIGRKPVTASAQRIPLTSRTETKIKETPEEQWLWDAYDRLPELHYGVGIRRNIAGKFDYFPARRDTPVSEPDRIGEAEEGESVSQADQAVVDVFENEGGADLLRAITSELVVHWDITGLAYLVAVPLEDKTRTWVVYSSTELKKQTDGKSYARTDTSGLPIQGEPLIDADNVYLVWRPHPRNSRKPDSPLRSSLEVAEQLILLNREMRARSLSRLAAGILWIDSDIDFTDENDEALPTESFEQMLTDRLTRPIKDVGSAGSVVPWVIKATKESIEASKHQTFDRDWEISRDDREELIKRLANGMDMPPEVLLGISDLNHWSAWQVQESTVSQHVAPSVDSILSSLTVGWFIPILEAAKVPSDGVVLWRDITPAVVPADNNEQHFEALKSGVIGFAAAAERLGYDVNEAPTPEDIALLLLLNGATPGEEGVSVSDPLPQSEDDRNSAALMQTTDITILTPVIPEPDTVDLLPLAELDAAALDFVLTESEAGLDRLIEKAAARARSRVQGQSKLSHLRDLPNDQLLLETVGMFQTNELVTDEDLAPVIARIRRRLSRTQDEARDTLAELIEAEPTPRVPEEDQDLDEGMSLLSAILLGAAFAALSTPSGGPDPVDVGETRDLRLPVSEIRDAMSTVGGGFPEYGATQNAASWELIGNGRRTQQTLTEKGAASLSFTWLYGNPSARVTNFDPHVNLNGVTFTEWDDPQLDVTGAGAWTGVTHYRPGDHRGCLCRYRRTVSVALPVAASGL